MYFSNNVIFWDVYIILDNNKWNMITILFFDEILKISFFKLTVITKSRARTVLSNKIFFIT